MKVDLQEDSESRDGPAKDKAYDAQPPVTTQPAIEATTQQMKDAKDKVSYLSLYRYASRYDILLIAMSSIGAISAGAILPCFPLVFGDMAGLFQSISLSQISREHFDRELVRHSLYLVYFGIGSFSAHYISTAGFMIVGEHLTRRIRERYLSAILRQTIGFFDLTGPSTLSSRATFDCKNIQDGVSEKVAFAISAIAATISAYIIGFTKSWKLTLVASSILVVLVLTSMVCSRFMIRFTRQALRAYAQGGSVAEESFGAVRTVASLGIQDKFARKYEYYLAISQRWGFKKQAMVAIMMAVISSMTFMSHSLTFWVGSRFVASRDATVSEVITVAFAILIGSHMLGQVVPHARAFATALAAGSNIFPTIDRKSPIDPTGPEGNKLGDIQGAITFDLVTHAYPSRPEQVVLNSASLIFPAGKVTAVVGPSGSGKSTIINLIQRYYSPTNGRILLDGSNIGTLNLQWYREQMAVVNQEPILFGTTIFENIKHGILTSSKEEDSETNRIITQRVEMAAKLANAHDFISVLPDGYETKVGEGGFKLSGGQKQRVAIARALVRDPKVLLLDEATSALDSTSEGIVQDALSRASAGRTTIVVAHRLSTIKSADNIVVLDGGHIVEQGNHDDLIAGGGLYSQLVEAQKLFDHSSHDQDVDEIHRPTRQAQAPFYGHQSASQLGSKADFQISEKMTISDQGAESASHNNELSRYSLKTILSLILSFNRPEVRFMAIGLCFSLIAGCATPSLAFLLANAITNISQSPAQANQIRKDGNFWSLMMFICGLGFIVCISLLGLAFAFCSERLIFRARSRAYRAIIHQDISFFDRDENKSGALASLLAIDAKNLSRVTGMALGSVLMTLTMLVASLIIALAIGWKLGLVGLAIIPILLSCGFLRVSTVAVFERKSDTLHKQSAGFITEIISNIRTVASFGMERTVAQELHRQLVEQERKSRNSTLKSMPWYAASQSFAFFCVALIFWYGGGLIAGGEYSLFQFFLCFTEVVFVTQAAGIVFTHASDIGKAKNAGAIFQKLLTHQPQIETLSTDPKRKDMEKLEGHFEFRRVHFRYPHRPERGVLKDLEFTIKPGQHVAFVGASGCGKSTTLALLERFYDPTSGNILVDGQQLRDINVYSYRRHIGLVTQEPMVFQGTIRENILFGTDQADEEISEDKIVQACRDANIHEFIKSLPEGFDTQIGNRGVLLSGGQKQRLAIARVLIRNPRVLLLDEATSALDTESERVVQKALSNAAKGRTTIAVAHRLSTIQNADCIFVFYEGHIVEQGTHKELLELKGHYYKLVQLQHLDEKVH